ncbi:hypothetical protein [Nocardia pseudovaccinii]|uniref:hypothetical protein n=1 Tax=Nocardia pseudovaccinii TaxID=189540 RepID=UPI0007A45AC8|nr:hypothetical protein [Nocardia pseudovaccinii]
MIGEFPPHIARPGDLVGPLVWFRRQPVAVTHSPPTSTSDPRYDRCTEHRLACDCREAERTEELFELRAEYWHLRDLLTALIDGHPTQVFENGEHRRDLECRCQLCAFARQARLVTPANWRNLTHPTNGRP